MRHTAQHLRIPPFTEFVYSYSGVMEIELGDHHYLAPPQYGI